MRHRDGRKGIHIVASDEMVTTLRVPIPLSNVMTPPSYEGRHPCSSYSLSMSHCDYLNSDETDSPLGESLDIAQTG